jgi:NAD(P)-dependent dehydrogenase (short-subunit alcohol dehydrogenase family)
MADMQAILVIGAGDATGGAIAKRFTREGYIARGPDAPTEDFQLRFRSLFTDGEVFVFPCNAGGHVLMDALSERARSSYLFARATVGRFYAPPQVIATTQCELEPA